MAYTLDQVNKAYRAARVNALKKELKCQEIIDLLDEFGQNPSVLSDTIYDALKEYESRDSTDNDDYRDEKLRRLFS